MRLMKFTSKPGVIALALAGILASGSVWAVLQSSEPTLSIKGAKPYIEHIQVSGKLIEGRDVFIFADSGNDYSFIDTDGDDSDVGADISLQTIEWFIIEPGTTSLPAAGSGFKGKSSKSYAIFAIPNDGSALNKRIGFRITPTTSIGDPDRNTPIEVLDISKVGGQNPDGTEGGDHGLPNVGGLGLYDEHEDGLVDPNSSNYIIRLLNDANEDILAAGLNPQVNTVYTVQIIGAFNSVNYTDFFKKSIQWKLAESGGTAVDVEPVAGSENKQFKTQLNNSAAQARHSTHLSEQGMEIIVAFDNDPVAPANQ